MHKLLCVGRIALVRVGFDDGTVVVQIEGVPDWSLTVSCISRTSTYCLVHERSRSASICGRIEVDFGRAEVLRDEVARS